MGIEARMKELAREKGMKTTEEIERERLEKLEGEKKAKSEKKPSLNYLMNLQHKNMVLTLIDNEKLEGKLKSFNAYEICLGIGENTEIIVFKHAIKYFHEKK